ncbi:hypothetical protein [Actinophytocola sp.]|uniref:hypothetical protein n=1 Tax=Actinophytocola sp. TaxID=1872138 RepID=UPI002ED69D61
MELVSETATGGGAGFTVNRDNVLQIGAAFAAEATRLQDQLDEYRDRMLTKPALGDPASADFATALDQRLVWADDSYANRAQQYIDVLHGVADQCAKAAKDYGHTEEQVSSMMRGIGGSLG